MRAPVLVAPDAIGPRLRAPAVAAALCRGLERAGVVPPPQPCPVAGGGPGTIEVLLPALGGETADGFALVEDGATAIVEHAGDGAVTGARAAAAAATGAQVVVVAAGGAGDGDGARGAVEALEEGGGLRGAALVVLCDTRDAVAAAPPGALRDPRGVPMTAAGGGLAGTLWSRCRARLEHGPAFVLGELGFDARLRAARAVVVAERRLDRGTLAGRVAGEIATRARQAGVPCHAVAAEPALERFEARILDLQAVVAAATTAQLEAAGERIAAHL